MHSKIMILLWERWRRTRWAVIAACLWPLIIGRLMYVTGFTTLENAVTVIKIFWYFGFALLTFVLLIGHCETRDVDLSFPKRLFRFPVRTTTLLVVYLGYGIAAVALQALILIGFEGLFFVPKSDGWTTLLILETVYIVLQTLSWLGGPARFLCVALSLTSVYALLQFTDRFNLPMGTNILFLIIILLCGSISFWSVSTYRHGTWLNGWQWVDSFLGMFRKKHSKPFASAMHAQIWFESRLTGYLFPLATICLISPFLGYAVYWLVIGLSPSMPVSILVQPMLFVSVIAAWIAGMLAFGVYQRDHVSGASIFWLRRPMSTRSLAVARLHATALSIARVLAILTVVALSLIARDLTTGAMDNKVLSPVLALGQSSTFEIITITVLGLYGIALFYWTLLRFDPRLLIGGLGLIILTFVPSMIWGWKAVMLWVYDTLVVVLPVCVLGSFIVARRRNLITTSTLVIAACMFPLVVVSLWATPWWFLTSKGLPSLNGTQIIRLISVATLPFIPVVASPLLMEKLRHR